MSFCSLWILTKISNKAMNKEMWIEKLVVVASRQPALSRALFNIRQLIHIQNVEWKNIESMYFCLAASVRGFFLSLSLSLLAHSTNGMRHILSVVRHALPKFGNRIYIYDIKTTGWVKIWKRVIVAICLFTLSRSMILKWCITLGKNYVLEWMYIFDGCIGTHSHFT